MHRSKVRFIDFVSKTSICLKQIVNELGNLHVASKEQISKHFTNRKKKKERLNIPKASPCVGEARLCLKKNIYCQIK